MLAAEEFSAKVGTSIVSRLMKRYFVRLGEAVAEVDPAFPYWEHLRRRNVPATDPDGELSWDDFVRAIRSLVELDRFPGIGLRFGARLRLADYGVAGLAVASAPNFQSAMRIIRTSAAYVAAKDLINSSETERRGRVVKTFSKIHSMPWVGDTFVDEEISSCLSLMRDILPNANFDECVVSFSRRQPVSTRLYAETLKCRFEFDAEFDQISYPRAWQDHPLEHADPMLKQLMERQCELVIDRMRRQGNLVDRTRRILMTSSDGVPSLNAMAAKIDMPVHTYRRRLYDAGTNYKEIVYRIRMERASELLAETVLPIQEIAYLLGYEHTPNFHAAFKRHTGKTPTAFRESGPEVREA